MNNKQAIEKLSQQVMDNKGDEELIEAITRACMALTALQDRTVDIVEKDFWKFFSDGVKNGRYQGHEHF